ncbi:MAG: hypothetical protein ABI036_01125 [Fibrobacteria bacterium]
MPATKTLLFCALAVLGLGLPPASASAPSAPSAPEPAACRYLELLGTGEKRGLVSNELRLNLAFPDSLGMIAVGPFLVAPPEKAKALLAKADWTARPLSKIERRFLRALRDWMDGHAQEAGEEFAALLPKAPARLRSALLIDRAILMLMAGLPADAERDWRAHIERGEPCREAARKNLYAYYLDTQAMQKAQALVTEILAQEPKDKWANAANGYLARLALSDEEWEAYLKEKSDRKDSLFEIQIAYGKYLKEHKRYDEAKRYYTRGLEGAPRNGPGWMELADVYYRLDLPFLAQASLEKSFEAGISDPYVFELLGKVLVALSGYAADRKREYAYLFGVLDMHDLQWGLDPAWAERCWRLAERNLERGFPHDLHSRGMAQLLYHLYCHNGKVEAAQNLRSGFWFHFTGPAMPAQMRLDPPPSFPDSRLDINLDEITLPLVWAASRADFFEPF